MTAAPAPRLELRARTSRQAGLAILLGGVFVAAALSVSAILLVRLKQEKAELEASVSALAQRKATLADDNARLEQTLARHRAEIEALEKNKALLLQSLKELSPPAAATQVEKAKPTNASKLSPLVRKREPTSDELLGREPEPGDSAAVQAPATPEGDQSRPGRVSASMIRASADVRPNPTRSGRQLYEFAVWLVLPPPLREDIRRVSYTFEHPTFRSRVLESTDAASGFRVAYTGWGCLSTVTVQVEYAAGGQTDRFNFDQCATIVTAKAGASGQ